MNKVNILPHCVIYHNNIIIQLFFLLETTILFIDVGILIYNILYYNLLLLL